MSDDVDLDQMFTTAAAAMAFTVEHWDKFTVFIEGRGLGPVPICQHTMVRHGRQLMELVNPDRMPR